MRHHRCLEEKHLSRQHLLVLSSGGEATSSPASAAEIRDGPVPDKEQAMAWTFLIIAGLLEAVWATTMKQSQGFTRLLPSLVTGAAMIASVGLLSLSMKSLPLSIAYMAWTGIGAVGAFAVGVLLLGESLNALQALAALLIVSGLALMKFSA
jgi:quaternary ammonium compound-resistance protein SugE